MRPMKLRSQLVLLTLGNLFLLLAFAGAAGWVAAQGGFALSTETAWLMALCLLGAVALQLLPALALAKRIARSTAPLDSIAKALMTGAKAEMPPKIRVAELAGACDKLVHAVNAVQARDAALRAADRTKDEFFAMLGHELRNPLAALAAAAHVLRNAPSGEGALQVQHMSRLIEDLLDLSRVTRGKVSLSRQPLNLALTVEKTVHELRVAGTE